jgi:hypothetical protein
MQGRCAREETVMMRFIAIVCFGFLLAAPALAVDESIQIHREYVDRVLTMDDSAAGHIALAKWCESHNLADRARKHWEEAVRRDPDNKEARGALGFVRRGAEWVPVSQAAPPAIGPTTVVVEPTSPERRRALSQDILAIAIRYLGTTDPQSWEKGREQILMFREPEAAEPISRILGVGSVEMRKLACEALGQIPGEEAAKYLVKFTLGDQSEDVFKAAVSALASRMADRGVPMLVNALNGSEKALKRAAYALGEMQEWRAVPALIGHLKTQEPRVVTYDAPRAGGGGGPSAYFFSGTIVTYIADMTPVVAEAAVGWQPTIGAIPAGACLRVDNPRVTIHRTIIQVVPQPMVREALTKITGEDHEYRSQDYWKLLDKHRLEAAGNATPAPSPAQAPPPPPRPPDAE